MPIKITCKCGQGFAVKERLAGKAFECPECGARLKIPQPQPPGQPTDSKQRQQPVAKPTQAASKPARLARKRTEALAKRPGPPPRPDAVADVLGEAGLDGAAPPNLCPGCRTLTPPEAVLCINCGYNKKLGRKMQTQTVPVTPLAADRALRQTEGPSRSWRMSRKSGSKFQISSRPRAMIWNGIEAVAVLLLLLYCLHWLLLVLGGILVPYGWVISLGGFLLWAAGASWTHVRRFRIACRELGVSGGLDHYVRFWLSRFSFFRRVPRFHPFLFELEHWKEMRWPFFTAAAGFCISAFGMFLVLVWLLVLAGVE